MVTLGSSGDLHPFLAIARQLHQRGHDVHVLTQQPYEAEVRAEGLKFIAVVSSDTHRRTMQHPLLWHPLHGFGVLWRHLAVPAIQPTCDALGALGPVVGEPLVVLASPLAVGARFARDRWPNSVRLLTGYTAPMALRSTSDPMFLGSWRVPAWWPPGRMRRLLWWLLDRWKLEPMSRSTLTRWQRLWRTPQIPGSVFGEWVHSPDGGVALYPEWFAPVPETWRCRGVVTAGFPLYHSGRQAGFSPELEHFLAAKGRVAVIYPGSVASHSEDLIRLGMEACHRAGLAHVVLAQDVSDALRAEIHESEDAIHVTWTSFADLLKYASVLIHHGGIGTCAQAIASGTPQLILASAYDQFENGARLQGLGAARMWRLGAAKVESLHAALNSPALLTMRRASQLYSGATQTNLAAIESACDEIERSQHAETRLRE
ncbi:MAG: glycosyltransferase [Vitreoscilla sp.]|nr:glycosyltransferase [Vitreoscilla sp.]